VIRCTHNSRRAQSLVEIMKARTKAGKKGMVNARIIQGVANRQEKAVIAAFISGMAVFKRKIDAEEFERLVAAGELQKAMEIVPWDELQGDLIQIEDLMIASFFSAGERAIELMPAPARDLRLTPDNPAVKRFIDESVGLRIVNITDDARRAVGNVVVAQLRNGLNVTRTAQLIKTHVGLTERQSVMIMNLQLKDIVKREQFQNRLGLLESQGLGKSRSAKSVRRELEQLTDDKIELRTLRRSESAANNRARAIARTELNRTVNAAQTLVWNEASNQGLIDGQKKIKVWVTIPDNDRSDICTDLDGTTAPLINGFFFVAQTGDVVEHPPAHTNCRSSLVLEDAPE